MPEDLNPQPLANEPAPTDASGQPVIATDRSAIIDKYEKAYFTPEPTADPAVAAEPVAEPVVAEPAVVADPQLALLQNLMAEVAGLKAQLAPAKPEPVAVPATEEDWLKLLSEGKKSEGEKALAAVLGPQMKREAVQEALQLMQAEREVTEFATKIRQDNADLLDMEPYIVAMADISIRAAQAAGKINSPADYVKVYQTAVTAELEKARKLAQTLRGAGKQEAITRTQVVASSPTVKPNAVNVQREAPATSSEPVLETPEAYFAKRHEQQARNAGLVAPQGR